MMTELGQDSASEQLRYVQGIQDHQYCPNVIGNLKAGTNTTYSFLIRGKGDSKGSKEVRVLNTFFDREARVISLSHYVNPEDNSFTISLTCDLRESRATPDSLLVELRKLKFIEDATVTSMKNWLFDRQLFPMNLVNTGRVVALSPSILLELEDNLSGGKITPEDALISAGWEFVLDIVRRVKSALTIESPHKQQNQNKLTVSEQVLRENTLACLKATGWGVFTMQSAKSVDQVMVQHPPASAGEDARGNHFLYGIASGLVKVFSNHSCIVVQESYDSISRILTLTLAEVPQETAIESRLVQQVEEDAINMKTAQEETNLVSPPPAAKSTEKDEEHKMNSQKIYPQKKEKVDEKTAPVSVSTSAPADTAPEQEALESLETAINSIKGKINVENNEFVNVDEIVEEDLLSSG